MMKMQVKMRSVLIMLVTLLMLIGSMAAFAADGSNDNSLRSFGITTPGAGQPEEVDFGEYAVTVPAGTQEITLEPVTSNVEATY